jgi:flagellar biosynthetic protein FliO
MTGPVPEAAPTDLPGFGSAIAVSFLSLGLVCLAAYFALKWLSRRTGPGAFGGRGPLKVLARQSLDPKRSVFVLEAANRCFLVGAADGGLSLLAELDKEAVARDIAAARAPRRLAGQGVLGGGFIEILNRVLSKKSLGPDSPRPEAPADGKAEA